jgi:TPR repeat protein
MLINNLMQLAKFLTAVSLLAMSCAWAGDYDDGIAAARRGDDALALIKHKIAASNGDARSQAILGMNYENGKGVVQDYVEAVRLYKLSAAQGYSIGQYFLGNAYAKGIGILQNDSEAVILFKLAAAQNNVFAQLRLADSYLHGIGVQQDHIRAHMWYNLIAARGDPDMVNKRNLIAAKMTSQQIAEAQKLARECQTRNFKNCD